MRARPRTASSLEDLAARSRRPPSAARGWPRGRPSRRGRGTPCPSFSPASASAIDGRLHVRRRRHVACTRGSSRARASSGRTRRYASASCRVRSRSSLGGAGGVGPEASRPTPSGCGANSAHLGRDRARARAWPASGPSRPSARSRPTVCAMPGRRERRARARRSRRMPADLGRARSSDQRPSGRPSRGTRRRPGRCARAPIDDRVVARSRHQAALRPRFASFEQLERGDPPGRAHDAAAGMRGRAAHPQVLDRRPVARPAGHRPVEEQLLERELALEDVALASGR